MKKLLLCLAICMIAFQTFAQSLSVKQIIFFGDSLSDDGNLYKKFFKKIPKSPPYFEGRFSNGPTWAEHVGKYFYDKNSINFKNYAEGGATAFVHNPFYDSFIAPTVLDLEVIKYMWESSGDRSNILYVIWIGANDYLYDRHPNVELLTDTVIAKISSSIDYLVAQGARYFLVMNLPDLAKSPFGAQSKTVDRLHLLTVLHNLKLSKALLNLQNKYASTQILPLDIYQIFDDLLQNPDKYNQLYGTNFKNLKEACWPGSILGKHPNAAENDLMMTLIDNSPALSVAYEVGQLAQNGHTPCTNPSEYVFWDQLHPSAAVHGLLGKIVIEALNKQKI